MPIESANYINELDPTNPAAPDLLADTDNHLRMLKQTLKNTFPNLNTVVTATPAQLMGFTPIGGIIMWTGAIDAVPSGWALCAGGTFTRTDGAGTIVAPNLHEKFIRGCKADGTDMGSSGGSVAHTGSTSAAGAHSHSGSTDAQGTHSHGGATVPHALTIGQMPSHAHNSVVGRVGSRAGEGYTVVLPAGSGVNDVYQASEYQGGNEAHVHGIYADGNHAHNIGTSTAPDHTHTVTIAEGRPPYYTLAYIMKI